MTRIEEAFQRDRGYLFSVCYRMTGCAADAEEVVQETFLRALRYPPDLDRPLRPWLTRVGVNAARDLLRQKKRADYVGPWLPAPLPDDLLVCLNAPDARYDEKESVSFAFLRALEVLSPTQRAVVVLRDVLDLSVKETAAALEISESNAKVTHHRARGALKEYEDDERGDLDANRAALERLVTAFMMGDHDALISLLRDDVKVSSDGAGEFTAARKVMIGAERAIAFFTRLQQLGGTPAVRFATLSCGPALVLEWEGARPNGHPSRTVLRVEVDREGRVTEMQSILATRKLSAL